MKETQSHIPGDEGTKICNEQHDYPCFFKIERTVANEDSEAFRFCDCLPSCNSISYEQNVIVDDINNTNEEFFARSLMLFSFDDDEFIVFKRSASFGKVDMWSNIGGLLVFFLGASMLSIVEVFYSFVIKFINNLWWKDENLH
jgi:Amiloride-sensitive sodium channel